MLNKIFKNKKIQVDSIFSDKKSISEYDQELWNSFDQESSRQENHIELIASENYASNRILEAQGSILTNKYAEGYPGKRYYGGCEYVDIAEDLAIKRAKEFLVLLMQMFNRIRVHLQMLQLFCSIRTW